MNVLIPCQACREEGSDTTPTRSIVHGAIINETKRGTKFKLDLACGHEEVVTVTPEEKTAIMSALGYNVESQEDDVA